MPISTSEKSRGGSSLWGVIRNEKPSGIFSLSSLIIGGIP
jgi:hypothetical protein